MHHEPDPPQRLDITLKVIFGPLTIRVEDAGLKAKLDEIASFLTTFKETVMSALSDLTTEVSDNTTVIGSAITLLQGLKAQLDEAIASGDPAALVALSAQLDSSTNALAAAVAANTPVPA